MPLDAGARGTVLLGRPGWHKLVRSVLIGKRAAKSEFLACVGAKPTARMHGCGSGSACPAFLSLVVVFWLMAAKPF